MNSDCKSVVPYLNVNVGRPVQIRATITLSNTAVVCSDISECVCVRVCVCVCVSIRVHLGTPFELYHKYIV